MRGAVKVGIYSQYTEDRGCQERVKSRKGRQTVSDSRRLPSCKDSLDTVHVLVFKFSPASSESRSQNQTERDAGREKRGNDSWTGLEGSRSSVCEKGGPPKSGEPAATMGLPGQGGRSNGRLISDIWAGQHPQGTCKGGQSSHTLERV